VINVRRWWVAFPVVLAVLLAAAAGPSPVKVATGPADQPLIALPSTSPWLGVSPTEAARPPRAAVPVKATPVVVPARGTGKFSYAPGRGPVLGGKGTLRRFRVAVEGRGGVDAAQFAAQVEATLGDRRSWIGGGRLRLQRVSGADPADFTVYLATRDTAGRWCAVGGVNIRVGGRPYTSCRATGKVIINLDRWQLSAPTYVRAKVSLAAYRQYVINHEVGHELGHQHQGCPKRGGPAPVMVQQTLTLRGCQPYAWPRRGGRDLVGPYR
jgi:hypothetical protein